MNRQSRWQNVLSKIQIDIRRCEMKGKWTNVGSILALLLLALAAGLTQAQGPEPPGEGVPPQGDVGIQAALGTAPSAALGTGFTYQGQLKKDGNPINGNCDFQFSLWDAAGSGSPPTGGNQIGSMQTKMGISVNNGLFTIPDLDFGSGAFTGDARWLQIAVRCPAGSGSYTTLSPRQLLTPAPYALALPGLWTQQNATSPNLIGGYSGNSVTSGVVGATIGGGGASGNTNRVTDNYGTVGGGQNNQAGDGGGTTDNAIYATIGGGYNNTASGYVATVGGGRYNTAYGKSFVGGGEGNTANGISVVGGGVHNTASNYASTVGGGWGNTANGWYATVPGGASAFATHYGEMAYAAGGFTPSSNGDAQTSTYVMRIERLCEAGIWYDLYLNGNLAPPPEFLTIAQGRTLAFDALVVGRSNDGESAGYHIRGVVENVGGTVSLIGTPLKTVLGEDDPNWDVQALTGFGALVIQVRGNGETIRWVATVRTAEVSW